jgi:hypothetical protein
VRALSHSLQRQNRPDAGDPDAAFGRVIRRIFYQLQIGQKDDKSGQ